MTGSGRPAGALREELREGLDGFIVPRADEHLGEYVPASAERLAWLTGFTGSAGLAAVLPDKAAVFTDGRYVLQLAEQTEAGLWERRHITENRRQLGWPQRPGGGEHRLRSAADQRGGIGALYRGGPRDGGGESNPVDAVWTDRPPPPLRQRVPHPLEYAGRSAGEKREQIAALLRDAKQDAAVITDPASIAWLLNIRGGDVPYTPFALGFALVHADGGTELFMDPAKLPDATRELGSATRCRWRDARRWRRRWRGLPARRCGWIRSGSPVWFAQKLRAAGAIVVAGPDPCLLPKACKNEVEQQGARNAHARDAVAVCRFLHFLAEPARGAARPRCPRRHGCSLAPRGRRVPWRKFSRDLGAGEHGAIIHYRVTEETNRPIRPDEVYLIDSGAPVSGRHDGYHPHGLDRPRRAAGERARAGDPVMKGHIAIATLVFPQGVGGAHLDAFARRALWQAGLDYDHGTGHGVGSYLSVHEGPVSLSRLARPVPIAAGMILSNEPGYLPARRATASGWRTCCWCSRLSCPERPSRSCASRR